MSSTSTVTFGRTGAVISVSMTLISAASFVVEYGEDRLHSFFWDEFLDARSRVS